LISALIGREVSIVTITANEPPIENLRDRQIRFDINCKAENGELVNVEMSLNPDNFEPIRLEYHAGKLFIGQDIKGMDKTYDDLKYSYQISVLAKENFFPDEEILHNFEYYDPVNLVSLGGRTKIITLELSKMDKVIEKPVEKMSSTEHWAVFFRYSTDKTHRDTINEIIKSEEGIAMASEVLMTISRDEVERAHLMSIEKYELDTKSRINYAKREGIQIGKKKGKQEGKKEIIDLLKNGKSPEEIIRNFEAN